MAKKKDIIEAPWTDEQVAYLKAYQECGYMHEFTCMGHNDCVRSEHNGGSLIPSREGWTCPCGKYKQHWAYAFMFEPLPDKEQLRIRFFSGEFYYSKAPGQMLVISITGMIGNYIAEIVEESPLMVKVQEQGPFSRLSGDDFIINTLLSGHIQRPEYQQYLLEKAQEYGHPYLSGLASLGVTDGRIHEIYPDTIADK